MKQIIFFIAIIFSSQLYGNSFQFVDDGSGANVEEIIYGNTQFQVKRLFDDPPDRETFDLWYRCSDEDSWFMLYNHSFCGISSGKFDKENGVILLEIQEHKEGAYPTECEQKAKPFKYTLKKDLCKK